MATSAWSLPCFYPTQRTPNQLCFVVGLCFFCQCVSGACLFADLPVADVQAGIGKGGQTLVMGHLEGRQCGYRRCGGFLNYLGTNICGGWKSGRASSQDQPHKIKTPGSVLIFFPNVREVFRAHSVQQSKILLVASGYLLKEFVTPKLAQWIRLLGSAGSPSTAKVKLPQRIWGLKRPYW